MGRIIDDINNVEDVKKLNINELVILSEEIREYLIDVVSETGGHLASNLGVVELTLALHFIFESPTDKIIWDVGHQTYVHKIITGRKDKLKSLRMLDGISGFPKRSESKHDIFETGHSSTSISAGLGIARSRDIKGEKYNVISVIGDGALTGGMALEALNDTGRSRKKMIIVLNDNNMSICKNVGSISLYLAKVRTGKTYYKIKAEIEYLLGCIPLIGKSLIKFIRKTKEAVKQYVFNGGMLFEDFGFRYIGPIDGHDIKLMLKIMNRIKDINEPVLLHVITEKGKGYVPAEENPGHYHGVGNFDKLIGIDINNKVEDFSGRFGKKIVEIADKNSKVIAVTAAMKSGTGLTEFAERFPERFFDVGIAEQHAVTLSAGMAVDGCVPVFAVYSTFLQRAYDQIVHDVCMQNLHVVFAVDRAGLVGKDGETHQGVFDSGFLYQIPNLTIFAPYDYEDLDNMLDYGINHHEGPIVIRYPRGKAQKLFESKDKIKNCADTRIIKEGTDITIVTNGRITTEVIKANSMLEENDINAEILLIKSIKPLDEKTIFQSGIKTGKILFVDETVKNGTSGLLLFENLPENIALELLTLPDEFIEHGSIDSLYKRHGLDGKNIAEKVKRILGK